VEVYIPDRGWVTFDPTPSSSRVSAEQERIRTARENGVEGVDAAGSENGTWTPPQTTTTTTTSANNTTTSGEDDSELPSAEEEFLGTVDETPQVANITAPGQAGESGASGPGRPTLPPLSTLVVWGVLLVGGAAALRFTGVADRAYRALWLRWLPDGDPREEVEAAFERVEYVLERRYRERKPGETIRDYVADVRPGDAAERAAELRERARYAGEASGDDAAEAKRLARSLAAEYSRLPSLRR
jgi:hypothetical protein